MPVGEVYEHSLSQPMLPTIKVQEVHKTTTTILPPLAHPPRGSPVPAMSSQSQVSYSINNPVQISNSVTTINGNTTVIVNSPD